MELTFDSINVTLHESQAMIQIINANVTYCAWQRAGGKTGGGIGPRILHLSEVMPRSQIILFSDTYDRLTDRIVPNIMYFLESKLGLKEGVDFVKYKKPPEDWVKPIVPLDKFERVISFATGTALCLVSLHVEGSANAFNAQAAIGDEVKYCDEGKINTEVLPALRGLEAEFGHLPEYLSVWMFTDKYGPKIKWYLSKRKLVNHKAVQIVYTLQMEIFKLQEQRRNAQAENNNSLDYKLKKQIILLENKINPIRKHLIYFSDMKPYENLKAVGEFFFKRAKRICKSELEFNVSFLNHDPDRVENTFYPDLSAANLYSMTDDVDPDLPLIIALDYQWRIIPVIVGQMKKLPGRVYNTLNIVRCVHSLYPDGIPEAIACFADAYKDHRNRLVYYLYDKTATNKDPGRDSFDLMVRKELKSHGWRVAERYLYEPPEHDLKFRKIQQFLKHRGEKAIMINSLNCESLLLALQQAGTKKDGDKTKKDKSKEKNLNFPAEEGTDYTDAFDQLLWGVLEQKVVGNAASSGAAIRTNS